MQESKCVLSVSPLVLLLSLTLQRCRREQPDQQGQLRSRSLPAGRGQAVATRTSKVVPAQADPRFGESRNKHRTQKILRI